MVRAFDDAVTTAMAPSNGTDGRWLSIVGLGESGRGGLFFAANKLIDDAVLVVGGARHLALIGAVRGQKLEWTKPFRDTVARILERAGEPVCVLASGDPFWFGAGSVLAEYIPPAQMLVLPAPSTFSLAAARLGWPLQSTVTLGLHTARPESLVALPPRTDSASWRFRSTARPRRKLRSCCAVTVSAAQSCMSWRLWAARANACIAGCAEELRSRSFGALNIAAIEVKAGQGRTADSVRARSARQLFRA